MTTVTDARYLTDNTGQSTEDNRAPVRHRCPLSHRQHWTIHRGQQSTGPPQMPVISPTTLDNPQRTTEHRSATDASYLTDNTGQSTEDNRAPVRHRCQLSHRQHWTIHRGQQSTGPPQMPVISPTTLDNPQRTTEHRSATDASYLTDNTGQSTEDNRAPVRHRCQLSHRQHWTIHRGQQSTGPPQMPVISPTTLDNPQRTTEHRSATDASYLTDNTGQSTEDNRAPVRHRCQLSHRQHWTLDNPQRTTEHRSATDASYLIDNTGHWTIHRGQQSTSGPAHVCKVHTNNAMAFSSKIQTQIS